MSEQEKPGCQKCGCEYDAPIRHCTTCSAAFNKAGLCAWCGIAPRKPPLGRNKQSKYCEACQKEAIKAAQDRAVCGSRSLGAASRGRSGDHRENIRETKYGRDG